MVTRRQANTYRNFSELFVPGKGIATDENSESATPKQVAKKIRKFVKTFRPEDQAW